MQPTPAAAARARSEASAIPVFEPVNSASAEYSAQAECAARAAGYALADIHGQRQPFIAAYIEHPSSPLLHAVAVLIDKATNRPYFAVSHQFISREDFGPYQNLPLARAMASGPNLRIVPALAQDIQNCNLSQEQLKAIAAAAQQAGWPTVVHGGFAPPNPSLVAVHLRTPGSTPDLNVLTDYLRLVEQAMRCEHIASSAAMVR